MFIGAALKHLQKKEFKNIEIPQPSLPKQKQIVEKLDAVFADIDKAISATEKNIENAEALYSAKSDSFFLKIGSRLSFQKWYQLLAS